MKLRDIPVLLILLMMGASACSNSPTGPSGPDLSISAISPATGSTTVGTVVSISGKGFASGATVTIGGAAATGVSVQGSETITAITPVVASGGVVDVVVTSGGKTATLTRGFTFVAPSGANQAPVITSIRSIGSRTNQPSGFADLNETVSLVATVTDSETAPSALTYSWSGVGDFNGSGSTVSWHVPAQLSSTPTTVPVTLTVIETFVEGGITHRNTSSQTFSVSVHDSQTEILDMGEDFLTLFTHSEIPSDQVLHNFSKTCDGGNGYSAEKSDTDANRANLLEDFSKFRITRLPPVVFSFGSVCAGKLIHRVDACSQFSVHWEATYIQNVDDVRRKGTRAVTDGIDYVTAVLESNTWRLCHSNFTGTEAFPTLGIVRQVTW